MELLRTHFLGKVVGAAGIVLVLTIAIASLPPNNFPKGTIVHIAKNTSLSAAADTLVRSRVITSSFLFKVSAVLLNGKKGVAAGDYLFKTPVSVWNVAHRLVTGDQGLPLIKITIPEGSNTQDIAEIILKKIPAFNAPYFLKLADGYEGRLFPDTYSFFPNVTAQEVFDAMNKNFNIKFQTLVLDISLSGRKPEDILKMASLVEGEATSSVDRALIAGVLWKRLDIGMLLQTDVYKDTYKIKGLPPQPISNPSLESLKVSANPTKSKYLYFLADAKGIIHYAETYQGHLNNINKYLR